MAELERKYAELVRENRDLKDHLDLAVANIQRLTLDNRRLRQALDCERKITAIDTRTQR
jgi:regulator of replication initiation timing